MNPVVIDDCFGWLHPADGRTGVVLCNPFGYDALCTHRGWRALARRLADAGMPVVRFDYPGTGDAAGLEDDPGRIDAWIDSIAAAVRQLRAWSGVERVALVGLRLGATLAALAAQRMGGVDALVLLAPPVLGRRYIRELRAHRQSWLSTSAGMAATPIPDDDPYVEAFGFGLHGDDVTRLAGVDLCRDTSAPARRVLLLDSSSGKHAAALAQHYAEHGVAVEHGAFDEADRYLVEALYSAEPVEAFARTTAWLLADEPRDGTPARRGVPPERDPVLRLPRHGAVERSVAFGPCFGIYCEPEAPRPGAPAVLLINAGAAHHVGDGRVSVLLARRLATLGVASLRVDLAGLGDAEPPVQTVTLDMLYSTELRDDAARGADWLVAEGHARIVTFGVCGGAFASLHVCATHSRVVGAFGVNLQKFTWNGAVRVPGEHRLVSSKTYWRAAFSADKWRRALRGQTDASPLQIARVLAKRVVWRGLLALVARVERATGRPCAANDARALLREVHARKVQLRLVYGEFDAGLEEARMQLGASFEALRGWPDVRATVLPRLDHALFTREARVAVMADFEQWLCAGLLAPSAAQTGGAPWASAAIGTAARG